MAATFATALIATATPFSSALGSNPPSTIVSASTQPQPAIWLHYSFTAVFIKPLVCVKPACSDSALPVLGLKLGQCQLSFFGFVDDHCLFSIEVYLSCLGAAVWKSTMRVRPNFDVYLWCQQGHQTLIRTAVSPFVPFFLWRFPSYAWTPLFPAAAVFSFLHCQHRYRCCLQSRRSCECLGCFWVKSRKCVATRWLFWAVNTCPWTQSARPYRDRCTCC